MALTVVAGVLSVAACGDRSTPAEPAGAGRPEAPVPAAASVGPGAPAEPGATAGAIRPLPPAAAVPTTAVPRPAPVSLTIERLGLAASPVTPVGVEADGAMEVPAADQVGWYRYGARPGGPGSAVLAAHVAYDGVDGVFRHLADLRAGDGVVVGYADGSSRRFAVTGVERVPKSDLPPATWARDGAPRLVLITCGGEFDAEARSYEDNVVAYASPA